MKKLLFLCAVIVISLVLRVSDFQAAKPIEFVVVTPTYNNEKWCIENIKSVLEQNYSHWHMIIINDCSTDRTSQLLHVYIDEHHLSDKITLIDNAQNKGALQNLYETIHGCDDAKVIVTVDGDDWLAGPHVLDRLAQEYADHSVWLTYGQFSCYPTNQIGWCSKMSDEIYKRRLFRRYDWVTTHLRTFKAWLFKKIDKQDLLREGKFFSVAWDLAIMLPMLEMASKGHVRFIPDVLYIYNAVNPLSDFRQRKELQVKVENEIRNMPRYEAL